MPTYKITPAIFPNDKQAVTALFTAYTAALGIDLTFQNYQTELDSLPGKYSPEQGGCLLVARLDDDETNEQIIGCVAYRALPPSSNSTDTYEKRYYCEMKRLYLSPTARGTGIGTKLVEAIIQHARESGLYSGMRLDTLPYMESARAMYKRYGFGEVEKYYETPLEGTIFMGLEF
jgi:ribosomal protein S18 acetylase RimI-like enzyme